MMRLLARFLHTLVERLGRDGLNARDEALCRLLLAPPSAAFDGMREVVEELLEACIVHRRNRIVPGRLAQLGNPALERGERARLAMRFRGGFEQFLDEDIHVACRTDRPGDRLRARLEILERLRLERGPEGAEGGVHTAEADAHLMQALGVTRTHHGRNIAGDLGLAFEQGEAKGILRRHPVDEQDGGGLHRRKVPSFEVHVVRGPPVGIPNVKRSRGQ